MSFVNMLKTKFYWILIIAALMVFGNVITHQLVWDDHAFIINQSHQFPSVTKIIDGTFPVPDTGAYRPVRNAIYALTLTIFKDNPTPHHLLILVAHIFISFQVYQLLKLLIKSDSSAKIGSILFALLPIHVESINWVTAGYDLFFVIFYLAAIISHLKYHHQNQGKESTSYILTFLALFSNEIALTLPLMIVLIDWIMFKTPVTHKKYQKMYLTYFLLAGVFWAVRQGYVTHNPFETRVFKNFFDTLVLALILFGTYVTNFFIPASLSPDRWFQNGLSGLYSQNHNLLLPSPQIDFSQPSIYLPLITSFIWVALAGYLLVKKSKFSLPLIWVVIALLPVLRVVPLPAIYSDRYAYLASVGATLLAVMIYSSLQKSSKYSHFFRYGIAVLVCYYAFISYQTTQIWRDDFTLWNHVLEKNPQSASATSALGVQYFLMGDTQKSLEYHRQAAIMNPFITSFQQNYVSILVRMERYDEIIEFIKLILKTDHKNVNLYTILASTYDAMGDYDNAMANYQTAYDLTPLASPAREEIEKLVEQLDQKYQPVDLK